MGRNRKKGGKAKAGGSRKPEPVSESDFEDAYRHGPETEMQSIMVTAAQTGNIGLFERALEVAKATGELEIDERDSKGITLLHFSIFSGNLDIVKVVVKYGADVNLQDNLGFSGLFWATGRYPNIDIARYLIEECNADVNIKTLTGAQAIHGAALQGNLECLKLLLEAGADPHAEDNEGTTALDLAKDDKVKAAIHKVSRHQDQAKDKADEKCAQCGKQPESGLKRCGRCHSVFYCGKDCQTTHWKDGGHKLVCKGFVIARPFGYCTTMTNPYGPVGFGNDQPRPVKLYQQMPETCTEGSFLRSKQFVVKVQVPLGGGHLEMMVYNEDRTVQAMVSGDVNGYADLRRMIEQHGVMGVKGFFWAELTDDYEKDGSIKVFHGKCAPVQAW